MRFRRTRIAALLIVVAAAAITSHDGSRSSDPFVASTVPRPIDAPRDQPSRALGLADGAVPGGTTIFDSTVPGVGNLEPALADALRRAAADAGTTFVVDSGWRSPAYQQHLLDDAVAKYGSEAEAARWVARPDRSAHVSGNAVDLGPETTTAWLSERGAPYGLCQIYDNEPWHFELRPDAVHNGCPARYADAAHDPRLEQ